MIVTRLLLSALAALLALGTPSHAGGAETLLVTRPNHYVVGYQNASGTQMMSEWVPQGETVQTWTEMVTVQIFYNLRDVTPATYRKRMETSWNQACPGSQAMNVQHGDVNGYATMTWALRCPLNARTGQPEYTWMKAIQGTDSFYLVQKAYRFAPSSEQIASWADFLNDVRVCDNRVPAQACKPGT